MGLFSRFENKVEDTVDGAADKVFDSPISPLQICKRAEKQMKREKMVGAGKQFAPTLYTVLVNPDDDDRLFGYYPTLAGEVETYLSAKAQENGLLMDGQPLVRFIVDDGLRHGKFDIVAELVAAPIVEELREEEMARYGITAKPQGGYPTAQPLMDRPNGQMQGGYQDAPYDNYGGYQEYSDAPYGEAPYADAPYGDVPPENYNDYGYPETNAAEAFPPAQQGQAPSTNNFAAQQTPEQPDMQQAQGQMPAQLPSQQFSAPEYGQEPSMQFGAAQAAQAALAAPMAASMAADMPSEQPMADMMQANQSNFPNQPNGYGEAYPQEGWNNYPAFDPQQSNPYAQQQMYGQNPYGQMNPYGQPMPYDPQNPYGQPMGYGQSYPFAPNQAMSSQPFGNMPNMMDMEQGMFMGAMAGQAFQQNIIPNTMIFNPATIQDAVQNHNSGRQVRARLLDRVNQRTYTLSGNRVVIGRETSCNIVVNDINASRRHADITKDANGFWVLSDLQSTNGTFVNGRPVGACRLREGDLITIGMTTLVFTLN